MGEEKMIEILFYLAWRSFNSLPTYPFKGSKPNVVHSRKLFLFLLVDFKFEKGILKNGDERPQGYEIWKCEVELAILQNKV